MRRELDYLPGAKDDLALIYGWLAERAGSQGAFAYIGRIHSACLSLRDFPNRGSPRDDLKDGLRSIPFERRATIYYRVAGATVEILRVLYAGRDPKREFDAS